MCLTGSALATSCSDGNEPAQGEVNDAPFSLAGLDGHRAKQAIYERLGERFGLYCAESWEAGLDNSGLNPNHPEASGLADGPEPTPEILEAIRVAGSDPTSLSTGMSLRLRRYSHHSMPTRDRVHCRR